MAEKKYGFSRETLNIRHRLSHQQIDDWLEEDESQNHLDAKLKQMQRVREFMDISAAFEKSGIAFIAIKGPLLSQRLYNDATYRYFNDLDFLLDWQDMERAIGLLTENGYHTVQFKWPERKKRKKLLFRFNNQVMMFNLQKNSIVELHWKLFQFTIKSEGLIEKTLAQNLVSFEFLGHRFRVFNLDFELLYLVIHGGNHAWKRLKWLEDIHRLLLTYVPVSHNFQDLVARLGAEQQVALCNSLLAIYYPGSSLIPGEYKGSKLLLKEAVRKLECETDTEHGWGMEYLKNLTYSLSLFRDFAYRCSIIQIKIFPHAELNNKFIPPYPIFFYLYWPFHKLFRRFLLRK